MAGYLVCIYAEECAATTLCGGCVNDTSWHSNATLGSMCSSMYSLDRYPQAIGYLMSNPQAQDGLGLGVAGIYAGGVLWGVRWTENSLVPPRIYTYRDESRARDMLAFLLERYERFELADKGIPKPELVAARLTWAVQK